jgi:hypothetical protein
MLTRIETPARVTARRFADGAEAERAQGAEAGGMYPLLYMAL